MSTKMVYLDRFIIRRKSDHKIVHILGGHFVLFPDSRDGMIVFDKRFYANMFSSVYEGLEAVSEEEAALEWRACYFVPEKEEGK